MQNSSSNIRCFKLKNGMDIIGRTGPMEMDNSLVIERPLLIQAFPTPQGGIAVSMVPFLLFAAPSEKNEFSLSREDYFKCYAPDEKLEAGYLEQTSGIALARSAPSPMKM